MLEKFIFKRKTKESSIYLEIFLNKRVLDISNKIPFLKHLLEQMFFHSGLGIIIRLDGDYNVDYHHIIEDLGISLGKIFRQISKKTIIRRFVTSYVPLDESLSRTVIDVSGRGSLFFDCSLSGFVLDKFDVCIIEDFLRSFALNSKFTIHISCYGKNIHHKSESIFKSLGLSLNKIFLKRKNKGKMFNFSTK